MEIIRELLIPFAGTVAGSACVFFMKDKMSEKLQKILTGFAAGVMVAASIWSLILPSLEQSESMGKLAFIPATVGFWVGILFLLMLDKIIPHIHIGSDSREGAKSNLGKSAMMTFAIMLHNLPEGMAVGVVLAGAVNADMGITAAGALALALGIAIQNFPEGAIISMPLASDGMKKGKAFGIGVISGLIEPLGALVTFLAAGFVLPLLPYLLSFAAGAMIYVVVEELIPGMSTGKHSNLGTLMFATGFTFMMVLDVVL